MNFSIDQILEKTANLIEQDDIELAEKFCKKALEMEPENPEALEKYGIILLEQMKVEEAIQRCVMLSPEVGSVKYLYLGQLSYGDDALRYYEKGLDLLKKEVKKPDETYKVADVYCSIAEVYMADKSSDTESVERILKEALVYCPSHSDALLMMAGIELEKDNHKSAQQYLKNSTEWLASYPESSHIPAFDSRINAAKLMIEMNMNEDAVDILKTVQDENDEDVDLWNLYGIAYLNLDDAEASLECFEKAIKMMETNQDQDEELLAFIHEKIQMLREREDIGNEMEE